MENSINKKTVSSTKRSIIGTINNYNNMSNEKPMTPGNRKKISFSFTGNINKQDKNNKLGFININKNVDKNEVFIPVVASRENFNMQLKMEEEANKTLN